MKKLILLSVILIVGCDDDSSEEWICTTDYRIESQTVFEWCESAVPPCPESVKKWNTEQQRIYNSLDECESVCPSDSMEITDLDNPDGTGEYFTMYCKNNN